MERWEEITRSAAERINIQDDGLVFKRNIKVQADIAKLEIFEQYEALQ